MAITEGLSAKIVTYGLSADNDFYASDISYNEKGCASFLAHEGDTTIGQITLSILESTMYRMPLRRSLFAHR